MNEPNANADTGNTPAGETGATDATLLTGQQAESSEQQGGKPSQDGQQDGKEGQTESKDAKPDGAPEKYEFQMPEGMQVDAQALGEFDPIARELNLSQEQAQKLVDVYARQVQAQHEARVAEFAQMVEQVKADKEIGGNNLDASIRLAKDAIGKFGTPELVSALDRTGMGNHPEMVRLMARIGKAMAEDKFVTGSASAGATPDAAKVLFPSMA